MGIHWKATIFIQNQTAGEDAESAQEPKTEEGTMSAGNQEARLKEIVDKLEFLDQEIRHFGLALQEVVEKCYWLVEELKVKETYVRAD